MTSSSKLPLCPIEAVSAKSKTDLPLAKAKPISDTGGWERRCSRCRSRDFSPAACGEDHGEADCAPAAHGGPRWSRWMCLKEAVTPWGAHAGAGSCQDLWPRGERSPGWSRFAERACDLVGDPCWSSLCLKDCTSWKGPMLGQGKSVRRKEQQRQRVIN